MTAAQALSSSSLFLPQCDQSSLIVPEPQAFSSFSLDFGESCPQTSSSVAEKPSQEFQPKTPPHKRRRCEEQQNPIFSTPPSTPRTSSVLSDIQKQDLFKTSKRLFCFGTAPGDDQEKIVFNVNPEGLKTPAIYAFIDEGSDGKTYVGETQRTALIRAREWASLANRSTKTEMLRNIQDHPEQWSHKILESLSPTAHDAVKRERYWIQLLGCIEEGYNKRNGGGGGARALPSRETLAATQKILSRIDFPKLSVKRWFPLSYDDTTRIFSLALSYSHAHKERVVYMIRNTQTGDNYIGKTERAWSKRMNEHIWWLNHPEETAKKLYTSIRKAYEVAHESFEIGILFMSRSKTAQKASIPLIEKEILKQLKIIDPHNGALNSTGGGGGGAVHKGT